MSENVELLSCPFCGAPAVEKIDNPWRGWIGCDNCHIGTPINPPYGDKERTAWNSRVTTDGGETKGRCQGCGEMVTIDIAPDGHTRAWHDCGGDEGACAVRCPVQVLCGPVVVADEFVRGYEQCREDAAKEAYPVNILLARRIRALVPSPEAAEGEKFWKKLNKD